MSRRRLSHLILMTALLLPAIALCAEGKVKTYVSILPEAYVVERIGGEHVAVAVMVGPGQEPHSFEPTPKQVAKLAEVEVYFAVGMPFETRLLEKAKTMRRDLRIVDTRAGIKLRKMEGAADQEHGQGEPDPHFWMNPRLVKIQAANVCKALQEIDPAHAADYEGNLKALEGELDALDGRLAKALEPLRGREFMVYHPAFGYFADAYGLKQLPVEIGGKEPGAKQLAALIEEARRKGIKVIFVQVQFSEKSARAIADAIGGAVVKIDDLARDYMKNMQDIAARIAKAIR